MAKMNRMFSYSGTFNDVTQVHSHLYGDHMRNKRGTHKPAPVNASFQQYVDLNKVANPLAKVVKDALDPFRQDFRDGSMWGRLVGLFKTHLSKDPAVDFRILEKFEFYDKIPFGTRYSIQSEVTFLQEGGAIRVTLSSRCHVEVEKYKGNSYLQTLIVVFLDAGHKAATCSERVMLPLKKESVFHLKEMNRDLITWETQEQTAQWPIPGGTKTVLIAVKCEPCRDGDPISRVKLKGMRVVKVCSL